MGGTAPIRGGETPGERRKVIGCGQGLPVLTQYKKYHQKTGDVKSSVTFLWIRFSLGKTRKFLRAEVSRELEKKNILSNFLNCRGCRKQGTNNARESNRA